MRLACKNLPDSNGNPASGSVIGPGIRINWQAGPTEGKESTGAQVRDLLKATLQRLEYFQQSRFADQYNEAAIGHIKDAISDMDAREENRKELGILGFHRTADEVHDSPPDHKTPTPSEEEVQMVIQSIQEILDDDQRTPEDLEYLEAHKQDDMDEEMRDVLLHTIQAKPEKETPKKKKKK